MNRNQSDPVRLPVVTIGMPVFNGQATIVRAIESLLEQTYTDFELIISDNASTDDTADICLDYASRDRRIRFIKQAQNLGAAGNFHYVLQKARGDYFMWAAADDIRSKDYLEVNLGFLEHHHDYVASTSPTRFSSKQHAQTLMGDEALSSSDPLQRILEFFNGWHANSRFYSLFRRDLLSQYPYFDERFVASDWLVVLYLARHGKLNRSDQGWVELGCEGESTKDCFAPYTRRLIDWVFPFQMLTRKTWRLTAGGSPRIRAKILLRLARLNWMGFKPQIVWHFKGRTN